LNGASELVLSIELINRGFDVLHRRCKVELLLASTDGTVVSTHTLPDTDPRVWQPFLPSDPARSPLTIVINTTMSIPPMSALVHSHGHSHGHGQSQSHDRSQSQSHDHSRSHSHSQRQELKLELGLRMTVVRADGTPLQVPLYVQVANSLPWDGATGVNTLLRITV
jgi:hypothetical protein